MNDLPKFAPDPSVHSKPEYVLLCPYCNPKKAGMSVQTEVRERCNICGKWATGKTYGGLDVDFWVCIACLKAHFMLDSEVIKTLVRQYELGKA